MDSAQIQAQSYALSRIKCKQKIKKVLRKHKSREFKLIIKNIQIT